MNDFSKSDIELCKRTLIPLTHLRSGDSATIISVPNLTPDENQVIFPEEGLHGRFFGLGLIPGVSVRLLHGGSQTSTPLRIAVGHTRIALAPELAEKIMVSLELD
ncbi:MAG: FeoA family protein [Thermoguttaceae bacterium]